jgi:hypothetical protein
MMTDHLAIARDFLYSRELGEHICGRYWRISITLALDASRKRAKDRSNNRIACHALR